MKAVSNLRSRMKQLGETQPLPGAEQEEEPDCDRLGSIADSGSSLGLRRRARTSSGPAHLAAGTVALHTQLAAASPLPARHAWAVLPRKLRGLHPAPVIIYVRENTQAVTRVMDTLYDSLVRGFGVDCKDIRVTNVPTAFDLPSAVRRVGRSKQVVVVVGTLSRDKPWYDERQLTAVREFLLRWSQNTPLPLVDGLLVGDTQQELLRRVCDCVWDVRAPDFAAPDGDCEAAAAESAAHSEEGKDEEDERGYVFGQYLAHRAIEMFYFEHRGW
ncbi:hypothetical protein GGI11_005729 [Coemansia sp. RSA 2049]|nr:hypothetical protein GGI11_005729 [Coemansia sp. RSA 2049]